MTDLGSSQTELLGNVGGFIAVDAPALVRSWFLVFPLGGAFMSSGFDEAQIRRNWLERLGEKIPGFRGFQDRELRREVDKLQREYLSAETLRLKSTVRDHARRLLMQVRSECWTFLIG